ncbi:MAG: aldo/keto reductase, partial [Victivallaceae bacterium]|nr:aldo/keto reductase [Victivallaceae bacterium]
LGINLIHTAPGYAGGKSLPAFGEVMKFRRKEVVLALKGDPSIIPEQLPNLYSDNVDIIMPACHSVEKVKDPGLKERFDEMKQKGLVKYFGFSCHTDMTNVVKTAAQLGYFDCMLIAYRDSSNPDFMEALAEAKKAGIGIITMKGLGGGRRAPKPDTETLDAKIRQMLFDQYADTVLTTIGTLSDAEQFTQLGKELHVNKTSNEAAAKLTKFDKELMKTCGMCGSCKDCPEGVDIAAIQRYMLYHDEYGIVEEAKYKYRRLGARKTVLNCSDCGTCEQACPRNLSIRAQIKHAQAVLG